MARNSLKHDARPAMQFYVKDWLSEPGLRISSLEARGLWIDMLCMMWLSEYRGLLLINGQVPTVQQLAKAVGSKVGKVRTALAELETNNVFSRTVDNVIYSRRLYRIAGDELERAKIRQKRRLAGEKGAAKRWQKHGKAMANGNGKSIANGNSKITGVGDGKSMAKIAPASATATATANNNNINTENWHDKFLDWKAAWPADRFQREDACLSKFLAICKKGELGDFIQASNNYLAYLDYQKNVENFDQTCMLSHTFINKVWREWIGKKIKGGRGYD